MQIDIKTLYSGKTGELLRKHIESNILALDTVTNIKTENKDMIAVEVMAKQKAIVILKQIFKLAGPEKEKQSLKDNSKKYGL
jgi:hypothetical protein